MTIPFSYWIGIIAGTSVLEDMAQSGRVTVEDRQKVPQTTSFLQTRGPSVTVLQDFGGLPLSPARTDPPVLARTLYTLGPPTMGLSAGSEEKAHQTPDIEREPVANIADAPRGVAVGSAVFVERPRPFAGGRAAPSGGFASKDAGDSPTGQFDGVMNRLDGCPEMGQNKGVFDVLRLAGYMVPSEGGVRSYAAENAVPGATAVSDAYADVAVHLAGFMSLAKRGETAQLETLAGTAFNAAMIPGLLQQIPSVALQSGRARAASVALARQSGMTNEEMLEYLSKIGVGNEHRKHFQKLLDASGAFPGWKLLEFLTVLTLLVGSVFDAIRDEARRVVEEQRDRDCRRARSRIFLK